MEVARKVVCFALLLLAISIVLSKPIGKNNQELLKKRKARSDPHERYLSVLCPQAGIILYMGVERKCEESLCNKLGLFVADIKKCNKCCERNTTTETIPTIGM